MLSLALLPSLAFSLAVRGGIGHAQSALAHGRDASALLRRRVTSPVLSGTTPPLDVENMVIIGSGPAGFTAAIYAARASLKPLVFEGLTQGMPGGQLMTTTVIENFPGHRRGIGGPELMSVMRDQAEWCGAEIETDDVISVDLSSRPFTVVGNERTVKTHSIVICTGASARRLGLPAEENFWGRGIASCAICDGATPMFRNEPIAVVGGGDSACEEALYLTRYASKVYQLVYTSDFDTASQVMQERVKANSDVEVIYSTKVADVLPMTESVSGESPIRALLLEDVNTGDRTELPVRGLFYAIGNVPNTAMFASQGVEVDRLNYIVTHKDGVATSVDGVFAAGDVMDARWRQAIVAAGTGCMAALAAERYLAEKGLAVQVKPEPAMVEAAEEATEAAPAPAAEPAAAAAVPAAEGGFASYVSGVEGVALVKFVSPTCGACRALAPMLTRLLKKEFAPDAVTVLEVDVDSQVEWAKEAKVEGTPTVQVYRAGELAQSIRGVEPRATYISALKEAGAPALTPA